MQTFHFVAASAKNERRHGLLQADNAEAARRALNQKGLLVVRLELATRRLSLWALLNREVNLSPPVRPDELATLTLEWGALIEAGVTLENALSLSFEAHRRNPTRTVIKTVLEGVKGGAPFHAALAQHPRVFPPAYVALAEAGETSGTLGPTLHRLAGELMARRSLAAELRNALLYPAFLLVAATAAIAVLLTVVVPSLEGLLGDRDSASLPLATLAVIGASQILREQGFVLLGILAAAALLAVGVGFSEIGRKAYDRLALRLPILGELLRSLETGRFCHTLAALIGGGLPIARAMPLAVKAVRSRVLGAALAAAGDRLMTGDSLASALARANVLPRDAVGLVRIGERTGQLATALQRAADLHEARAGRGLKAIASLVAPTMTVVFGLLAGLIVYAMLSTILSINDIAARPP